MQKIEMHCKTKYSADKESTIDIETILWNAKENKEKGIIFVDKDSIVGFPKIEKVYNLLGEKDDSFKDFKIGYGVQLTSVIENKEYEVVVLIKNKLGLKDIYKVMSKYLNEYEKKIPINELIDNDNFLIGLILNEESMKLDLSLFDYLEINSDIDISKIKDKRKIVYSNVPNALFEGEIKAKEVLYHHQKIAKKPLCRIYKDTEDTLKEFNNEEVVITNSNLIFDNLNKVIINDDKFYITHVDNFDEFENMVRNNFKKKYKNPSLDTINRLNEELNLIRDLDYTYVYILLMYFNSTRGYFNYEELKEGSVSLSSNVRNVNIYKYLDKNDSASVFNNYKYVKENSNSYINFNESIEELKNSKYKAYIYKNNYTSVGAYGEYDYENIELMYELDSSHIFYIKIAATNNTIPKELIEKIEITEFKNYSSYINREVKDGYIYAELKEFTDYSREKIRKINITLPEKYYEIDKGNDIYTKRSYGMNYDEKKELYQYELDYQISYDLESTITNLDSSINSYKNRDNYKALTYVNDIILNEKTFKVYEAGYTDYSGAFLSSYNREEFYKKIRILVYQFDKKCFTIKVVGNSYDISDIMLKDVTNFNIVEE